MTEIATPTPRRLETVTCTRCCGTGRYSYCQTYGSTCFKCHGSGKQYTKRGLAAAMWLKAQKRRKGSEITLGTFVASPGIAGICANTYFTVDTLYTDLNRPTYLKDGKMVEGERYLVISGLSPKGERYSTHTYPDADVDILLTKSAARELLIKALDYQDTLTKAGTPRKGGK